MEKPLPILTPLLRHASLALLVALAGCAKINDVTMQILSSPEPALAVVHDRVLNGKAKLFTDRTGTLDLVTSDGPELQCMGTLRYTASGSGTVDLHCSDGSKLGLVFTALSETRGHARGPAPSGMASLTWGLEPENARAYLLAPPGKRLTPDGDTLAIE